MKQIMEFPVYFELDSSEPDAEATGGVHFFCSNECRAVAPTAGYGTPFKAGEQPETELADGTVCETCGKLLTAPEGVTELREFKG